jgi:hypothetical protein
MSRNERQRFTPLTEAIYFLFLERKIVNQIDGNGNFNKKNLLGEFPKIERTNRRKKEGKKIIKLKKERKKERKSFRERGIRHLYFKMISI